MALAFMTPAAVVADNELAKLPKVVPTFTKGWHFWWSPNRLDARPVIWSLQNHPEEWQVVSQPVSYNGGHIRHVPSNHSFYVGAFGKNRAGLRDSAYCGCSSTSRRFHTGQAHVFNRVAKAFMREQNILAGAVVAKQFHGHFVH